MRLLLIVKRNTGAIFVDADNIAAIEPTSDGGTHIIFKGRDEFLGGVDVKGACDKIRNLINKKE